MRKAVALIILATFVLAALCGLTGCSVFDSVTYANAEKYSVGDAEITDKIENLEIDWPSGSVRVVSHSENTVLLSEKAEDGMPEELRVHWWLEGTTLHVKFAASGAGLRTFRTWHKDLTLTVPEELSFADVEIRAASAEIEAADLAAETLCVSTASGNVNISCAVSTIQLNSASGHIQLSQRDDAGEVSIDTASGEIDANLSHADTAYFESSSGRIKVTAASVDDLSAKATSGTVSCELEAAPSECELHAGSGAVTLCLPGDSDFTARISTASGHFESDFPMIKDGSTYLCGSGSARIEIDTTSGDISLCQN